MRMRIDFESQSSGGSHCANTERTFIGCQMNCRGEWKHASERAWIEETASLFRKGVHVTISEQRTYQPYMAPCR